MSTTTPNSEYLFLFRGDWCREMSPQDLQATLTKFMGWFERLSKEGKLKGGQPLAAEGKTLTGKNGRTVADGPFLESKESIGGYFIVYADSLDQAVSIAKECPSLEHGAILEVRPIAEECPTVQRLREAGLAEMSPVGA